MRQLPPCAQRLALGPLILPPTWFIPHGDGPVALTHHPASCSHPSRASRAQTSLNPDRLGPNHIYWSFAVGFLEQSIMISFRNHSSRYTSTWAGSIQIKPPLHLGRTRMESAHRTGLLTRGAFVSSGNYFEQHGERWLQEGVKILCVYYNAVQDDCPE